MASRSNLVSFLITDDYCKSSVWMCDHKCNYPMIYLTFFCGGEKKQKATISASVNKLAVVNSESACDSLIVEVTGDKCRICKASCKSHQVEWITSSLERIGHLLPRFQHSGQKYFSCMRAYTSDGKQSRKINYKTKTAPAQSNQKGIQSY